MTASELTIVSIILAVLLLVAWRTVLVIVLAAIISLVALGANTLWLELRKPHSIEAESSTPHLSGAESPCPADHD
jgi:hypothetical protein